MRSYHSGSEWSGSNGNEEVLRILQSSSIIRVSSSDCLVSYPEYLRSGGGSYLTAEMQSVYSTAPADWAVFVFL